MKPAPLPAIEVLNRVLALDVETGVLTRRWRDDVPLWINIRFAGALAGTAGANGYIYVSIDAKKYLAHRVIWKMVYGEEVEEIDHKDRDRKNNRPKNLRAATRTQNRANAKRKGSLPRGVTLLPSGRFRAAISMARKNVHLGCFDTQTEAHTAYAIAARTRHGEFSRTD